MRHLLLLADPPALLSGGMTMRPAASALIASASPATRLQPSDPCALTGAVNVAVIAAAADPLPEITVPDFTDPLSGLECRVESSTGFLAPYADYLVVNVSSPNTPGLRDLQQPDALIELLDGANAGAEEEDAAIEEIPGAALSALDFTRPETRDWFAEHVLGRDVGRWGLGLGCRGLARLGARCGLRLGGRARDGDGGRLRLVVAGAEREQHGESDGA